MCIPPSVGASGGEGAALHLRRVFDPFETLFAIMVEWFFLGYMRVLIRAVLALVFRALMARATGLRGRAVLAV